MANILIVIPYEFYPPRYGGALRCFYILRELAREHNVILLTVQTEKEFLVNNSEISFPSNVKVISTYHSKGFRTVFNLLPSRLANAINCKILNRSFEKRGNLYLLNTYIDFKKILKIEQIDFVVFENLECFGILQEYVKRFSPRTKIIYDAHNVDSELWKQQAESLKMAEFSSYSSAALEQEANLYKNASLVMCCSEIDKNKFLQLNKGKGNFVTVPNGVDTELKRFDHNSKKSNIKKLLFCGTLDYSPNIQGLKWFYENVFYNLKKQVPEIRLIVIGKLNGDGDFGYLKKDNSVDFLGEVTDVVPYYLASSISIVPLFSGSGTRLKILEAMSIGNPIVSTSIGAEGLELIPNQHYLLGDQPEFFLNAILMLCSDSNTFESIRKNANQLIVKKYDWKVIGKLINENIKILS